MAGRIKKFSENTSTIPEVMDPSTLNFNPNFKFSRVSASKPWSISIVCKNFVATGAAPPKGRNILSKKVH